MGKECIVGDCIWAGKDRFCDVLSRTLVPMDGKWPLLILYLRGISDNTALSEVQKSRLQELLITLMQQKEFTQLNFEKAQQAIYDITTAHHTDKLNEIARETSQLAKDMLEMFGKHRQEVSSIAKEVDAGIAKGVEPASLLAGLRDTLKDVVSQMEQDADTLVTLSHKDSLTGLANRRSFDAFLDKAVDGWIQDKRPVSLIFFDIDHFKNFNDTYGHLVGDQVLRALAVQVRKILAPLDDGNANVLGARYGGEEFAVVLCGEVSGQAPLLAEAIRKAVEKASLLLRNSEGEVVQSGLRVTVSLGVAAIIPAWNGAYQINLVDSADKALYTAKRSGRNCTVHYQPENAEQEYVLITSA